MAVPKRRHSSSRTRLRRSTWRVHAPQTYPCPQCREPKLPHRVCPNCGYYGTRQVIDMEAKEERKR